MVVVVFGSRRISDLSLVGWVESDGELRWPRCGGGGCVCVEACCERE